MKGGGLKIVLGQKWQPVTTRRLFWLNPGEYKGASHQPAFIDNCLTISHTCLSSHVFALPLLHFCLYFSRKMREPTF